MSVKQKVNDVLNELDVESYFLEKDDNGVFPFVVFNISEKPLYFSDDEEEVTIYMITINIFSKPDYNFESLKMQIIQKMLDAGFRKTQIPNTEFFEAENVYNQPMGFSYFI